MATNSKMAVCLWFDSSAEEAAKFYTSVFKNSSTGRVTHFGKEGYEIHGRKEGSVMTMQIFVNGLELVLLNGGPLFKFNEAVSLVVNCDNQDEIDYYWEKLGEGGDPQARQCGWLKDKYGVSWQVTPQKLDDMFAGKIDERSERAMKAMLKMKKLDIAELEKAYNGQQGLAQ